MDLEMYLHYHFHTDITQKHTR